MDSVVSWLLLNFFVIIGFCFFIKSIITEIEQRHKDSEEAWREWEREYF